MSTVSLVGGGDLSTSNTSCLHVNDSPLSEDADADADAEAEDEDEDDADDEDEAEDPAISFLCVENGGTVTTVGDSTTRSVSVFPWT